MTAPTFCARCGEVDRYCTCPADDPAAGIDRGQYDDPGPPEPDEESSPPSSEPWTELGCTRRLAARFGAHLRHVGTWNKWLAWDGRRWRWTPPASPPAERR
jgi:hypothetical protein